MKDNILLTALALFLIVAITGRSCMETDQIEPVTPTKIIQFVDAQGHYIVYDTDNPDPWEEVQHMKTFPNNPDLPPVVDGELLLCDSLTERPDPFFLSLGAFLDPPLLFQAITATVQMGFVKDSFIVQGDLLTGFSEAVQGVTSGWFSQTQNSFDSLIFKDNFALNPDSNIINPDFWMAIVGSTADENECPGIFIHFPEFNLGIACLLDEYSIGNAYIREDTLRPYFEALPSVRTFSSGGVEVIDSGQLHSAIEVLVDSCQAVPNGTASLQGVGVDSMQMEYLIQSGRIIIE